MTGTHIQTINGSLVVIQTPGLGTGDCIYHTADGNVWRNLYPHEVKAGQRTGEIRGTLETRRQQ